MGAHLAMQKLCERGTYGRCRKVSLGAVAHGGPAVGTTYADIGGRLPMQNICERGTYADMGGHLAMQKICERGTYADMGGRLAMQKKLRAWNLSSHGWTSGDAKNLRAWYLCNFRFFAFSKVDTHAEKYNPNNPRTPIKF